LLAFKMNFLHYYETVHVRHSLMIVGQTGVGKNGVEHKLAAAMTACHGGAASLSSVHPHPHDEPQADHERPIVRPIVREH